MSVIDDADNDDIVYARSLLIRNRRRQQRMPHVKWAATGVIGMAFPQFKEHRQPFNGEANIHSGGTLTCRSARKYCLRRAQTREMSMQR